jgi:hypothetical protein
MENKLRVLSRYNNWFSISAMIFILLLGVSGVGWGGVDVKAGLPMEIPVLIVKYFPVQGENFQGGITGEWGKTSYEMKRKIDQLNQEIIKSLEQGSRYHGYKDRRAKPSLKYRVVGNLTFNEKMPSRPQAGEKVPLTDYQAIMNRIDIRRWVEKKGVKEVWIWGYHAQSLKLWESNMAGPFGDISNSNRDPNDLPVLDKTYTVYHYNFTRTASEAMEDHMHQIEALLNHVDRKMFWERFVGSREGTGKIIHPGCGWAHFPPNGEKDYDWANPRSVYSDIEDWKPDGTGKKKQINCWRWRGENIQWFVYWMQNLPGADNRLEYEGRPLTNWWTFVGDFDNAMKNKIGLVRSGE